MKCNNIHTLGIPEGEEEEQGAENLFEKLMTGNFPNLMREKVMQHQEAQKFSIKRNPNRPTLRHIKIKMANFKDKERIVKAAREKQLAIYKGAPIRLPADFSTEHYKPERIGTKYSR